MVHLNEKPVVVETHQVACDGHSDFDKKIPGHPKIYLTFKSDSNTITCPYCSRMFTREAIIVDRADSPSKTSKKK